MRKRSSKVIVERRQKSALQNYILRSLPSDEYKIVTAALEPVSLQTSVVLHEIGEPVTFGYFVNSGLVSSLTVMSNGDSVEVGIVGNEGFTGLPALLNISSTSSRLNVQVKGDAVRISTSDLHRLLPKCPTLQYLLSRFSYLQAIHMGQIAACNRLHGIEERLARWLLMTQDRIQADMLPLTHEFLSNMLGSRRSSVTISAGILQKAGIVQYRRGKLYILDREKLEGSACECYGVVRMQLEAYLRNGSAKASSHSWFS